MGSSEMNEKSKECFIEDNVAERDAQKSHKRQTWSSQLDFIMTSLGSVVGLGNIWRFPYLCYKNGGGAFFIPYLLSLMLVAGPNYILDMSLGQYMGTGCVGAWKIVPIFEGVGFAVEVAIFLSNIYYIVIMAWTIYYIYVSFASQLPWTTCNNSWNTARCFVTGSSSNRTQTLTVSSSIPTNMSTVDNSSVVTLNGSVSTNMMTSSKPIGSVVEFWENHVLDMSSGIEEPGSLVPGLTVSLLIAWILVYICICRGIRWSGKIAYVTVLLPYVLLLVMLIRGLMLEGAATGILFYLQPDFSRLIDAQVWLDGCTQVMYSIGLSPGANFGSYNRFHDRCVRNGLVIAAVNCFTSIFAGLVVFSILGFMANETNQPVDKVVSSGPGLIFLAYPTAVAQMPLSQFWSVLFFTTILFVGIDSQFTAVESLLVPVCDKFPRILFRPRNRMILVGVVCVILFLLGLPMVTQGGVYLFRLMDYYSCSGYVLMAIVFFETFAISWIYGADRFYDSLEVMLGYRCNPWLKICWKYLAPSLISGIFCFELVTFRPLKFDDNHEYPAWATGFGILLTLCSSLCIPVVAVKHLVKANGTIKERWREVTTPRLKQHQIHPTWVDKGYRTTLVRYKSYEEYDNTDKSRDLSKAGLL